MGIVNIAMRVVEFVMALLVIALTGNMIADSTNGNPAVVNFAIFCGVFAMLCLFFLIPAAIKESLTIHPALPLALDVLNALFWFCAAVALAAKLGVHDCDNNDYTKSNSITNGSNDRNKRCTEAQASTAFLWFGFAAFVVSAVMTGMSSGSSSLRPSGIRRRGPAMSQV